MSLVVFTRLERPDHVARKYGDFSLVHSKQGPVSVHGVYRASGKGHGDQEMTKISEQFAEILADAKLPAGAEGAEPWLRRAQGNHPKVGCFVAYRAPGGLVIKVTAQWTEIVAPQAGCPVPDLGALEALRSLFAEQIIADRSFVTQEALVALKSKGSQ